MKLPQAGVALLCASAVAAADDFGPEQVITNLADGAFSVHAADLDGDLDLDVLSASGFDDKIAWYENTDGLGTYGPQQLIAFADNATSVWAADLDGDLDLDVLSASSGDDTIAWYENTDGLGTFGPKQVISTSADGAFSVQAADLDGDLDLDVVAGSFNDDKLAWYENTNGLGSFGSEQVITTIADFFQTMSIADLDGDLDLDILSASALDDKIAWYENTDGAGTFGPQQVITAVLDIAQTVFAVDFDGDLDKDLLAGWFNNGIGWFSNDGSGNFTFQSLISTVPLGTENAIAADVDGDGDMDAISASGNDDTVAWYENTDGLGTFGPQQVISTTADFVQLVFAADVDGDLDVDVLAASFNDDEISWFENVLCSASGASAEVVRVGAPANPSAFLPGVTTGPVICETWDPVIDHTTFFPTAVFDTVGLALAPLNLPFPPAGTILCDFFSFNPILFTVAAGTPFAIPFPNQCNLVGVSLCSQGLSTDGFAVLLTNALDLTVGTF